MIPSAWTRFSERAFIDENSPRLRPIHLLLATLITLFGGFLRFFRLDQIPPGLWYDEALYALDGLSVLRGHFPLFFDVHGHPREPMFPYLLAAAFKIFSPTVLSARCVSAVIGTAAVALFFPVARRIVGSNWGLLAMAAFAAFRWPLHFSRTVFRAGLAVPFTLAVIWMFLRWREKRRPVDAALCGCLIGASMYTYISMRVIPILLAAALGWLALRRELVLKRDLRHLAFMAGAALLTVSPLLIHYARTPQHISARTSEISMFEKTIQVQGTDGRFVEQRIQKTLPEALSGLAGNAWKIAKMWTVQGDHVARHNLPHRPVFDWLSGLFFFIGILCCMATLTRHFYSPLLLLWLLAFCAASLFSFGAPNILRMQGAAPAAVLLFALGLKCVVESLPARLSRGSRLIIAGACVLFFASNQVYDYFVRYARSPEARREFLTDTFYAPAVAVQQLAPRTSMVYIPREFADTLTVQFVLNTTSKVVPYDESAPLPAPAANQNTGYLLTGRSLQIGASSNHDHWQQINSMPHSVLLKEMPSGPAPTAAPWAWLYTARADAL